MTITFMFSGCGGGGTSSSASSDGVIRAEGSVGARGANYIFESSLNISWEDDMFDSLITLSNFKLLVDGSTYPISYSTSKTLNIDPNTNLVVEKSTSIPYSFAITLPFSSVSRLCSLKLDYEIAGEVKHASVPCQLEPVQKPKGEDGDESFGDFEKLDATTTSLYTSQPIFFTGMIKENDKPKQGAKVSYAVLTPSFVVGSKDGELSTDKNGVFTLNLKTAQNPLQEKRVISILISYNGISSVWKVEQAASPEANSFELTSLFKQEKASKPASTIKYIGSLKSGSVGVAEQSVSYSITPSSSVSTPAKGTVKTDEFGNFNLEIGLNENTTGVDRDINVVLTYKSASDVWNITQSSQSDEVFYKIEKFQDPKVSQLGGQTYVAGRVMNEKTNLPVSNASINFDILMGDYVNSNIKGVATTDEYGKFKLPIDIKENLSTKAREISVVFTYQNAALMLNIKQDPSPEADSLILASVFKQEKASRPASTIKYIGSLKSGSVGVKNKTIDYTITPSTAVTNASGSIDTDEFGNFTLEVELNENTTGVDRDISVVLVYQSLSDVWNITQSSQSDEVFYKIEIPSLPKILAAGGSYDVAGIVTNKKTNQPVANASVRYDILTASYVDSPIQGEGTTDEYGKFKFSIDFNKNTSDKARDIPIVFTYSNAVKEIKLNQSSDLETPPFEFNPIVEVDRLDVRGGSPFHYGKLTKKGRPMPQGTIIQWALEDEPFQNLTIDNEFGMYSLSLPAYAQNLTNIEIPQRVVFKYEDASYVWKFKQLGKKGDEIMLAQNSIATSDQSNTVEIVGSVAAGAGENIVVTFVLENFITAHDPNSDIIQTKDQGRFNIKVTYSENPTKDPRVIPIVFSYKGGMKVYTINQAGVE